MSRRARVLLNHLPSTSACGFDWAGLQRDYIPGLKHPFLVVRGARGFAGCGYVAGGAAEKTGDAAAIFRGVPTHDAFLAGEVQAVSPKGAALGIRVGMLGREALPLLRGDAVPPGTPAPREFPNDSPLAGLTGWLLPGLNRPFLVLAGRHGFLACGYVCPDGARDDAAAIFTGVSTHEDFLSSKALRVSEAGAARGLRVGMTGAEAAALVPPGPPESARSTPQAGSRGQRGMYTTSGSEYGKHYRQQQRGPAAPTAPAAGVPSSRAAGRLPERLSLHALSEAKPIESALTPVASGASGGGAHAAPRCSEREALDHNLRVFGFEEVDVPSDGNCQFASISWSLYGVAHRHGDVRKAVIAQLRAHPALYVSFVDDVAVGVGGGGYEGYVARMVVDGEWGDHVTLQAAADALQLRIHVVTSYRADGGRGGGSVLTVTPRDQSGRKTQHKWELWVSYCGEHYNPIVKVTS